MGARWVRWAGHAPGGTASGKPVVRRATAADVPAMVHLHMTLLPPGLFPALGERFLRNWHRTFLDSRYGVALVATEERPGGGVAGFLLGSIDHASYMSELVANRAAMARLASAGTAGLLRRPQLARRFLRTRARTWPPRVLIGRRSSWTPSPRPAGHPTEAIALLDAVAVRPEARRCGVATALIAHFMDEAQAGGATRAQLVTDTTSRGAVPLYERLGWTPAGDYTTWDGGTVRVYQHAITALTRNTAN